MTNFNRPVYRSLVAFPISTDPKEANTPVPDLATDTGTVQDDAKTWKFTLKDGVTWQDGKAITCEDFKYGASRVFATDVITGGPNYLLSYLDVPRRKDGLPAYKGPYKNDRPGRLRQGGHLRRQDDHLPLQEAVAGLQPRHRALHMMDPFRAGQGQGRQVQLRDLLQRPLQAPGRPGKRRRARPLVRNDNYDPKTDTTTLRKALPDKIVFTIGSRPRPSTTG